MKHSIFAIFACTLFVATAEATPIYVDPTTDGSSVDFYINEQRCALFAPCRISGEISSDLDGDGRWLGIGGSWTFDFFDVSVGGLGLVDDFGVYAALAFLEPDVLPAGATGGGQFFTLFGLISGGSLLWDQPDPIDLGDGSWLQITFEDVAAIGAGNSTTVSATVARYSAVVPEPGTLALFGLWFARQRRPVAAKQGARSE